MPNESLTSPNLKVIRRRLLKWGRINFRHYPWRTDCDPYRTLVTEILLRQTSASHVLAVRKDVLERFPNQLALASASQNEIFQAIKRLGFGTQRAKQLKQLGTELGTRRIPASPTQLMRLPGVGAYAAAATACFAFGRRRVGLQDVNVVRVIGRVFGIERQRGELRKDRRITWQSQALADSPAARQINWALLDLGAIICRPRPLCAVCPLSSVCTYAKNLSR